MKVNKELLIASINIILISALIALATSCATQDKMVGHYYKHSKYCPAYDWTRNNRQSMWQNGQYYV